MIMPFLLIGSFLSLMAATSEPAQAQEKEEWSWVENERGLNYLTYIRSDDSRMGRLESFGGPISYLLDNGDWAAIDTTIVPSATRDFEMVKAGYNVFFFTDSKVSRPIEFVSVLAGNPYSISYRPVSLGWVGPTATAMPTQPSIGASLEGEFTYSDIFGPGIDLRYELRNTSMKELLEIRDIRDLPIVPPGTTALELRFAFEFTEGLECVVDGVVWDRASRVETDNQVYFTFKGENVFWMGRPRAYDNARERTALTYVLEEVGRELHVSLLVPYPWLSDKSRIYPITLDPTTYVSTASDGYAYYETAGDATYAEAWEAEEGSDYEDALTYFKVGQRRIRDAYWIYRGFLFFDTENIPDDATVTSAVLSLYISSMFISAGEHFDVVVQTGAWDEDEGQYRPFDPLDEFDYNKEWYSDNGGSIWTGDLVADEYFDIVLNATGRGWVKLDGMMTKFAIRSSRDISGTEPANDTDEYINISSYEAGDGYWPMLVVEYTEAAPPIKKLPRVIVYTPSTILEGFVETAAIHVWGTIYGKAENGQVWAQVLDNEGQPVNDATVTLTVWTESGSKYLDNVSMSYLSDSNGIYTYDFTTPSAYGVFLGDVYASWTGDNAYGSGEFQVTRWAEGAAAENFLGENFVGAFTATVYDNATKQPLESALVTLEKAGVLVDSRYTREDGKAFLEIAEWGVHVVRWSKEGYKERFNFMQIDLFSSIELSFFLEPEPDQPTSPFLYLTVALAIGGVLATSVYYGSKKRAKGAALFVSFIVPVLLVSGLWMVI